MVVKIFGQVLRQGLSFSVDIAGTISGYKIIASTIKNGKPIYLAIKNGIVALITPSKDVTGVNFAVSQADNALSDNSFIEKGGNFVLNIFPFKGTYDGIKDLTDDSPKVKFY